MIPWVVMSKKPLNTTMRLKASEIATLQRQTNPDAGETIQLQASEIAELNKTLDAELSRMYAEKTKSILHVLDCAIRAHRDPDALITASVDGRQVQVPQRILRLFRFLLRSLTQENSVGNLRSLLEIETNEYDEEEYEQLFNKLF